MTPPAALARQLDLPDSVDATRALTDAQSVFRRGLAAWASGLLELRRAGLNQMAWPVSTTDTVHLLRAA